LENQQNMLSTKMVRVANELLFTYVIQRAMKIPMASNCNTNISLNSGAITDAMNNPAPNSSE